MPTSKISSLIIALFLFFTICGCAGGGTTGSGGASVRGTIVDQQNNPLAGVTVTVFDPSGQALASSTSAADGSFDCGQVATDSGSVRFDTSDGSELAQTDYMIPSNSSGVVVTVTRKPNGESETEVEYEAQGHSSGGGGSPHNPSGNSGGNDDSNDNSGDDSNPGHVSVDDNSGGDSDSGDMISPPSHGNGEDGGGSSGHDGSEDTPGSDSGKDDDSGHSGKGK